MTRRSNKMFRILSKLGHIICALGTKKHSFIIHLIFTITAGYPRQRFNILHIYFHGGKKTKHCFALIKDLPSDLPIHNVGNPRLDLLRKEFAEYYEHDVAAIKKEHGKFILINTNFGNVNSHLPIHNLFYE